ncbi:CENPO protein, partial [Ptilonorhynchus violaceus]|nr:CENPO protein [Ptilonorhynchus violaceus]
GVLAHLEMLEARAHQEAVEQEEKEQREERLAFLKARVQELRLQRDELRDKLDRQEKAQLGKEGIVSDPALPSPRAVLEWKIRSLRGLLQVFQLTGFSGKLSRRGLRFSLRTSYEGSYLDSFHLELLLRPEFRIRRHSVPAFIPLEQLARKFLPSDLRSFLNVLSQHLNGFVGRRHQAEQLQEQFSEWLQGAPRGNSLCNLLTFRYSIPGKSQNSRNFPFRARLLYGDPCRSLPTEVAVSCSPDAPAPLAEAAAAHSELFRSLALPRAFRSL